ncbi:MAG: 3-phosphoshikimate 1-carboxyvinyltransferase, partial [Chlamydiia bacterium]|nr:3-phosphoshikimate 1-carboxyvinyltransferase [Chlamydiia bacterium]
MSYHVTPGPLSGTIEIPPSKSHTHRALLFALLAKGTSKVHKYLDSPDSAAMLKTIKAFGATVEKT